MLRLTYFAPGVLEMPTIDFEDISGTASTFEEFHAAVCQHVAGFVERSGIEAEDVSPYRFYYPGNYHVDFPASGVWENEASLVAWWALSLRGNGGVSADKIEAMLEYVASNTTHLASFGDDTHALGVWFDEEYRRSVAQRDLSDYAIELLNDEGRKDTEESGRLMRTLLRVTPASTLITIMKFHFGVHAYEGNTKLHFFSV